MDRNDDRMTEDSGFKALGASVRDAQGKRVQEYDDWVSVPVEPLYVPVEGIFHGVRVA